MRDVFGDTLLHLSQIDSRVYALDGDLATSTKSECCCREKNAPKFFLQMGIAEQKYDERCSWSRNNRITAMGNDLCSISFKTCH
ncbi:hypothetical protein GCM10020331_096350 [Ectobacillus funiculus]